MAEKSPCSKILCALLSVVLGMCFLISVIPTASACFGWTIECEGVNTSSGGGLRNISVPEKIVKPGESHKYTIHVAYSPGCGSTYSAKFHVTKAQIPTANWTWTLQDTSKKDIEGVEQAWSGTGDYYAELVVNADGNAVNGDFALVSVRLWFNDTAAKNQDDTIDIDTKTLVDNGGPIVPVIDLISPNGGQSWEIGTQHDIVWSARGGRGAIIIKLEYSTTGAGGSWILISNGNINDGQFTWTIPNTPSTDCYVKATATDSDAPPTSANDTSASAFEITAAVQPPSFQILSPNGGEVWLAGSSHNVTWTAGGGQGALLIMLTVSTTGSTGPWTTIANDEPNDGSFTWTVPSTLSTDCYIQGSSKDTSSPPKMGSDSSDNAFTITDILPAPTISLTKPNGGEVWEVGSRQDITWTASGGTGMLTVSLEYSTAGATGPWTSIATGESNDGIYNWTVPNATSKSCYIKATVSDSNSPPQTASDAGNAAFEIKEPTTPPPPAPTITLFSPNGGEVWEAVSQHDITWTASEGTGTLYISLQYSTTGINGTWTPIVNSEPNDGIYAWSLPNVSSENCSILATVTDSAIPPRVVCDRSDAVFAIRTPVPGQTTGSVTGTVEDTKGKAIVGALVTVFKQGSAVKTTTTDTSGAYTFTLDAGDYELNATKAGYKSTQKMPLTITAGWTSYQNFVLQANTGGGGGNGGGGGSSSTSQFSPLLYGLFAAIALIIVAALAIAIAMKRRRKDKEDTTAHYRPAPPPQPAPAPIAAHPAHGAYAAVPPRQMPQNPQPQSASDKKVCKKCGATNEKWQVSCGSCKSGLG